MCHSLSDGDLDPQIRPQVYLVPITMGKGGKVFKFLKIIVVWQNILKSKPNNWSQPSTWKPDEFENSANSSAQSNDIWNSTQSAKLHRFQKILLFQQVKTKIIKFLLKHLKGDSGCLSVRPSVTTFFDPTFFWPKAPNLSQAQRELGSSGLKGQVDPSFEHSEILLMRKFYGIWQSEFELKFWPWIFWTS